MTRAFRGKITGPLGTFYQNLTLGDPIAEQVPPVVGGALLSLLPSASATSAETRRFPNWGTAKAMREAPVGASITTEADGTVRLTKVAVNRLHQYSGSYVSHRDGDKYYCISQVKYTQNPAAIEYTLGGTFRLLPEFGIAAFDGAVMSQNPAEPRTAYMMANTADTATLWRIGDVRDPVNTREVLRVFTRAEMKLTGALASTPVLPNSPTMDAASRWFSFTSFPQPGGGGTPNTVILWDRQLNVVRAFLPTDIPFRQGLGSGSNGFQAMGISYDGTFAWANDGGDAQGCIYSLTSHTWSSRYINAFDGTNDPLDAGQPRFPMGHQAVGRRGFMMPGDGLCRMEPPATFAPNALPDWANNEPLRSPTFNLGPYHMDAAQGLTNADGTNEWVLFSHYQRAFGQPNTCILGWEIVSTHGSERVVSVPVRTPAGAIPATVPMPTGFPTQPSLAALQATAGTASFYNATTGVLYVRTSTDPGEGLALFLWQIYDVWADVRNGESSTRKATHIPVWQWRNDGGGVWSTPYYASGGYRMNAQPPVGCVFGRAVDTPVGSAVNGGGTVPRGASMTYDRTMTKVANPAALTGEFQWCTDASRLYVRLDGGRSPRTSDVIDLWAAPINAATLPVLWANFGTTEQRFGGHYYSLWNSGNVFDGDLYWTTPRAAASRDGRVIFFGSNLGECLRGTNNMPVYLMCAEMPG